jgi:hypothetical protein
MKTLVLLPLALALTLGTQAQSLQDIMNKAMQQQGQQPAGETKVTIEENKDPFTPLTFTGSYRMEVHTFKNCKEEKDSPNNIRMAFNTDHMAMMPVSKEPKEEMRMVFDLRNKFTYTLITDDKGERTGMKMKMMKVNVEGDDTTVDSDVKVVRTNETKVIDGHTCRKYTYSDKEGSGEAWIAEDIDFDMMAAMRQMVGGKKMEDWQRMGTTGVVMENTWTSADGKEKVVMYTRDLVVGKVDEAMFSTKGYEVQDMTAFPMPGQ